MPEEERAQIETLNLRLGYTHEHNTREQLAIGVVPEDTARGGTISLVVTHWRRYAPLLVLQLCLNEDEIGLVIRGLALARRRLRRQRRRATKEA